MKIYLYLLLLLILSSCKDDVIDTKKPLSPTDPVVVVDTTSNGDSDVEIYENVTLVSTESSSIVSTEAELESGIYAITFTSKVPVIAINDIIIGDQGEGFLRKVQTISTSENTLTMQTEQATFEDIFKKASFSFSADISDNAKDLSSKSETLVVNYLAEGVSISEDGFSYNFSNTVLFEKTPLKFEIIKGSAKFDPKISFKSDFGLLGMTFLDFGAKNSTLDLDVDLSLKAEGKVELPEFKKKLADISITRIVPVGPVPVVITINTVLEAELKASVEAEFDITTGFTNNYPFSTEIKYENSSWSGNLDVNPTFKSKPIDIAGKTKITQNLILTPKVSIKFFGILGPYLDPRMTEDFSFAIASPSLDWDSNLKGGVDITAGLKAEVLGKELFDFKSNKDYSKEFWKAPDSLKVISGDKQNGILGKKLAKPVIVKVTDSYGNPMPLVPVYFKIKEGEGSVGNDSVVTTNDNGIAEAFWTLGSKLSEQKLEASYKNSEGKTNDNKALFSTNAGELQINFEIESGNNQEGKPEELLAEPLKIKATDSLGNGLADIKVYFLVETGGGTISEEIVQTDENGFAQIEWTLGNELEEQTVEASIRKADGETVASIVIFEATVLTINISLTGDMNFGEVTVNEESKRTLFIENISPDEMTVSTIDWPVGFSGDWSMGIINPGETKEVEVTFAPTEAIDYTGEAVVQVDLYDDNNSIAVSGTGLELVEETLSANLQSDVWFLRDPECEEDCGEATMVFNSDGTVTFANDGYDSSTANALVNTYTLEGEYLTINWIVQDPYYGPDDEVSAGCEGVEYQDVYVFNFVLVSENVYGGIATIRFDRIGGTADCILWDGYVLESDYLEIYKVEETQARITRSRLNNKLINGNSNLRMRRPVMK